MSAIKLGKYLTLTEFCQCSNTYKKYDREIDPLPKNPDTIKAIKDLNQFIIEPIIDNFGRGSLSTYLWFLFSRFKTIFK